jgi:hypothetical protein
MTMATHHPLPADLTTGSVMLDIGDDAGALLITTDASRVGEEIELQRVGDGQRTHVAVLTRRVGATVAVHAAVYASLRAGEYTVLDPRSGAAVQTVRVTGGEITTLDWRRSQPSPPPGDRPTLAASGAGTAR